MNFTTENFLLIGSLLLFISLIAGKTSFRLGVPTLIFFLFVGMLAGTSFSGLVVFNDAVTAQFIGIVALNFILFAGGFETNWISIKPILRHGITLSTLGVVLTALFSGFITWLVTDFSFTESFLIGSIISSTDAAAVFSILRSKNLALKGNLRPTLELESGSNDPMAYLLTIIFLGLATSPSLTFWEVVKLFLSQIIIGVGVGVGFGYASKYIINNIKLEYEGLYPVLAITLMLLNFSLTDFIGGNGFMAVYLSAIFLGNSHLIHKKTILKMFDGLAWLMQIILFITLGLLVNAGEIIPHIGNGLLIAFGLMFIARPLSVFISLSPYRMKNRERWYIAWVGLRGAVPIVLATYPLIAGMAKAQEIFNIVFFITLTSVLIQGTSLIRVAKWFRVLLPQRVKQITPVDVMLRENISTEMVEVDIPDDSCVVGKRIVDLNFPEKSLIVLIQRNDRYISPTGATVIEPNDKLIIVAEDKTSLRESFSCLSVDANAYQR